MAQHHGQDTERLVSWSEPHGDPNSLPPYALVVSLGALVTPTVILSFLTLRSIWLTYASLYYCWVVVPSAVCFLWSGARARVMSGWRHGRRNLRRQLCLALPLFALVVGSSLLAYSLVFPMLGLDMGALHAKLAQFGLTPDKPVGDLGALAWLTLLNPLMEEGFWRLFLFQMLLPRRQPPAPSPSAAGARGVWENRNVLGGSAGDAGCGVTVPAPPAPASATMSSTSAPGCWSWWGPCLSTACLYASYHVPVVWSFLPAPLCLTAFVGLVGLGVALQLIVERVGLVLAIGVHLAYDFSASVIIAEILFGWGMTAARLRA